MEEISEHLRDPSATVWMDFCLPTAHDLATISVELGLHELAVEDAVHEHQRPKLDRYDTHAFMTAYAVWLDTGTGQLQTSELAAFITPRALVTVRKDDHFDIEAVVARWDGAAAELATGGGVPATRPARLPTAGAFILSRSTVDLVLSVLH